MADELRSAASSTDPRGVFLRPGTRGIKGGVAETIGGRWNISGLGGTSCCVESNLVTSASAGASHRCARSGRSTFYYPRFPFLSMPARSPPGKGAVSAVLHGRPPSIWHRRPPPILLKVTPPPPGTSARPTCSESLARARLPLRPPSTQRPQRPGGFGSSVPRRQRRHQERPAARNDVGTWKWPERRQRQSRRRLTMAAAVAMARARRLPRQRRQWWQRLRRRRRRHRR